MHKNETRQAFENMMLSGRMNQLMTEAVKEGIIATQQAKEALPLPRIFTPVNRSTDSWPIDEAEFNIPPQFR